MWGRSSLEKCQPWAGNPRGEIARAALGQTGVPIPTSAPRIEWIERFEINLTAYERGELSRGNHRELDATGSDVKNEGGRATLSAAGKGGTQAHETSDDVGGHCCRGDTTGDRG